MQTGLYSLTKATTLSKSACTKVQQQCKDDDKIE